MDTFSMHGLVGRCSFQKEGGKVHLGMGCKRLLILRVYCSCWKLRNYYQCSQLLAVKKSIMLAVNARQCWKCYNYSQPLLANAVLIWRKLGMTVVQHSGTDRILIVNLIRVLKSKKPCMLQEVLQCFQGLFTLA